MKHPSISASRPGWVLLSLLWLGFSAVGAPAADWQFETQLIWGTNDPTSPDPSHKPVDAEVRKKLADLPLKWTNYFEVQRKQFSVVKGESTKVELGVKCAVEVKILEGKKVEVTWFGRNGEEVGKQTQPLRKGEYVVLGGNAPNATVWLVTLKRID
jgi:hypothetical protein